jgi:hypothetical protein
LIDLLTSKSGRTIAGDNESDDGSVDQNHDHAHRSTEQDNELEACQHTMTPMEAMQSRLMEQELTNKAELHDSELQKHRGQLELLAAAPLSRSSTAGPDMATPDEFIGVGVD